MAYTARVLWNRGPDEAFVDSRYSRAHTWAFDGGTKVPGAATPQVVPQPLTVEAAVDPEEAFVASIASCHMLWFLSLAAEQGFVVESYDDTAEGALGKNAEGRVAMTRVVLRPRIAYGARATPSAAQIAALHHEAHERCFIANSVTTEISVAPS
jgi:organic hydroperoxide reductase OsmC/OhrA